MQRENGDNGFCGNDHGLYTRSGDGRVGPDVVVFGDVEEPEDGAVLPRDAEARADEAAPVP